MVHSSKVGAKVPQQNALHLLAPRALATCIRVALFFIVDGSHHHGSSPRLLLNNRHRRRANARGMITERHTG